MGTILKWAGNKTLLIPELKKYLPPANRLVEPFAGSCAVMMATDYPEYLIADINPDLINMYQVIANYTEAFLLILNDYFELFNGEENYYRIRNDFNNNANLNIINRAACFLYLNRHGYRGLCRYNKSGKFNVPYGNYKSPYFPEKEIRAFAQKAEKATFICADYKHTLTLLKNGDVVYFDPPYHKTFSSYYTDAFTENDHCFLASNLLRVSERYPVVLSNSDTPFIRDLYRDFIIKEVIASRRIGIKARDNKKAKEIICSTLTNGTFWGIDPASRSSHSVVTQVAQ